MEKKTKRGEQAQSGGLIEKELGPLGKAIDDAVAGISDEQERDLVRQTVGEAVHGALRQLSMPSRQSKAGLVALAEGDNDTGEEEIAPVQELGFVEFTTGLINGTFDALITATVKQMKAYSELVADLAKTLTQFRAEYVSDADVTDHLASRYPDGKGGTSIRPDVDVPAILADTTNGVDAKTPAQHRADILKSVKSELQGLLSTADETSLEPTSGKEGQFTKAQVTLIRDKLGQKLAKSMIEHLRAMASEGMARIVITDGELLSKMTYKVTASKSQTLRQSQYKSRSLNAKASGGFSGGLFKASASSNYNTLNVSAVNEASHDQQTMSAEIIGQVRIKFRTESFAPVIKTDPIV